MTKKRIVGIIIAGGVAALATFVVLRIIAPSALTARSLIDSTLFQTLTKKPTNLIDTSRLAPGITPPTNKWFSGFALQSKPQPTFPSPLSFTPTDSSFEISLPKIKSTSTTLFGSHFAAVSASITDARSYQISRYDELSIDLAYKNEKAEIIGTVTATAGSPYVFYEANRDSRLVVSAQEIRLVDGIVEITVDGTIYNIVGSNGVSIAKDGLTATIAVPREGLVSLYAQPIGKSIEELKKYALNKISTVAVVYQQQGDGVETTFTYTTKNHQPTAYTYLPHQNHKTATIAHYDTLYGESQVATGIAFAFTTPVIPVSDSLDISHINADDRHTLVTTLRQDINATQFEAIDTYFGGKNVYRAAQLLKLAKALGEDSLARSIQEKLSRELSTWFSGTVAAKSFFYDETVHGIVAKTASFGADGFNDHHFHYGYFIYAASILAQYDSEFLTNSRASVDLLVADIANYNAGEKLPLRRSFDPYVGHSWASGASPFADGNNQESISEAINAWVGTSLWAAATHNDTLKNQALWMLSNEAASGKAYWTDFDRSRAPYNQGYSKSIISLNWGGKRDYATFFSAEPNAILGIQLLPMSPTTAYLSAERARIADNTAEVSSEPTVQFADYILMYKQLDDGTVTLDQAQAISGEGIDSANSRAYLYAWILSHKK